LHAQQVAKAMKAINGLTVAAADCDANKQIGAAYNLKGAELCLLATPAENELRVTATRT